MSIPERKIIIQENQSLSFKENGYLHLKNILPKKLCLNLKKDAEEYAQGKYINYWHMHEYKHFKDFHIGYTLCNIADQLCESRMIPVGSTFFFCKPNSVEEFGSVWHQDNLSAKAPYGAWLTMAVCLDDADETNGALKIIPGSHRIKNIR
mgnify:CR=1 FL=1